MGNSNPSTVEISFPNKLWIGEIAIQKSINKKKIADKWWLNSKSKMNN